MTAAPHNHPTNSDLHRCECSAMADLLSLVLPSAYGAQSAAELGSRDYERNHNRAPAKSVVPTKPCAFTCP